MDPMGMPQISKRLELLNQLIYFKKNKNHLMCCFLFVLRNILGGISAICLLFQVLDMLRYTQNPNWLVVSTPLKNISQLRLLFPIYGKIKNVPNQVTRKKGKYCPH